MAGRKRRTSLPRTSPRLSVRRGYGIGSFSRGAMSFACGFIAEEAGPYLKLPEGKKLSSDGKVLKLVDL